MAKKKNNDVFSRNNLKLKEIEAKTNNQKLFFEQYNTGNHMFVHGCPGTGKSFLGCYLAIKQMIETVNSRQAHKKLIILRSVVPSRDVGFLPGSLEEKAAIYEMPYVAIFAELFQRADAYDILKNEGIVEFTTTSFLRGLTFTDAIVFMDETQNATFEELNTVISRVGENTRILFSGDFYQNDLNKKFNDKSGFSKFMHILECIDEFTFIQMQVEDIVRSALAKKYIMARIKYESIYEPLT